MKHPKDIAGSAIDRREFLALGAGSMALGLLAPRLRGASQG